MRYLTLLFVMGAVLLTGACADGSISNVGVSVLPADSATADPLSTTIEVYNLGTDPVGPVEIRAQQISLLEGNTTTPVAGAAVDIDPPGTQTLDPGERLQAVVTLDTTSVSEYGAYVTELVADVGSSSLSLNLVLQWVDPTDGD